jgi:hypothetical protein
MACKGSGVHRAWPPRRSTEGAIVRLTSSATRSRRFHSEPCCLQWHVNPAERQPYGRYRFARYGAIDEIVRAEVGRRWVPGAVSIPRSIRLRLPEGGARRCSKPPSGRASPLNQGPTDRRPSSSPGLLAQPATAAWSLGEGDSIASTTSLWNVGKSGDGADDRGPIRQGAPPRSG